MKLLPDENLSPALATLLLKYYSDVAHVRDVGLKSAPDSLVWANAAAHGFTILTKDADFHHRSFVDGYPPKVIWIRLGNCSTRDIAQRLICRREEVHRFVASPEQSFLVLA